MAKGSETRRRLGPLLGYIALTIGMMAGFILADHNRADAKRDACRSTLAVKVELANVVDISFASASVQAPVDPSLPDSIKKLIEDSKANTQKSLSEIQRELETPLVICESVGIDSIVHLKVAPQTIIAGTTTTTVTTSVVSTPTSGSAGARGPAGTPGSQGPPGSSGTSPTTRPPPTTTTTSPLDIICRRHPLIC